MPSENNKRIAKNTIMLYIRMGFSMLVSLYTSRIILNSLGVVDFGLYSVVGGVVALFGFLNSALGASSSRFLTIEIGKKDFKQLNKYFSIAMTNHAALSLIIFILAETIGLWFLINKLNVPAERFPAVLFVYQVSIGSSIISLVQTPFNSLIIAHEKMGIYAIGGIIETLLKLGIALAIGFIPFDKLITYSSLILVVSLFMFGFYCTYVVKKFPYCRYKFQTDSRLYKTTLAFTGWDLLGNLSAVAQGQGLNVLLNTFFGPVVNAARGVAFQLQGSVVQFSSNFLVAVKPQIMKLYAEKKYEQMKSLIFNSSKYSYLLLFTLSVPVLFETEYIIIKWLGTIPENTVVFVRIVLFTALFNTMRNPIVTGLHSMGRVKLLNIFTGGVMILSLPVSYLLLHIGYPPHTVFVVTLVLTLVNQQIDIILLSKYFSLFKIQDYFKNVFVEVFGISIIILTVSYILHSTMDEGFFRLFVISLFSIFSVLISVLTLNKSIRLIVIDRIQSKH